MAKHPSANITSRRGAMKIGAAAVLAASPVAAITAPAPAVVDPIYAAIERHRAAWTDLSRAIEARDVTEDAARHAFGTWKHPSVAPYETAEAAAAEVERAASSEVAQTRPTTVAGIAAVLAYARDMQIDCLDGEQLFPVAADCRPEGRHSLEAWLLSLERAAAALASA